MKKLILICMTLLMLGCVSNPTSAPEPIVNKYGDTAQQAEVREWITSEVIRINEKRAVVNEMLNSGEVGYAEYFLLMDECAEEKRTIPDRARARFLR